MCDPIVGASLAVVGQGADFAQQYVYHRAAKKVAARNSELASQSARLSYEAIDNTRNAETIRAQEAVAAVRRDAEVSKSLVVAGAAEGVVGGTSVSEAVTDFERQEGEYVASVLLNERFARQRAALEREATSVGQASRELSNSTPAGPNPFAHIAQAGSAGYSAYQMHTLNDLQINNAELG